MEAEPEGWFAHASPALRRCFLSCSDLFNILCDRCNKSQRRGTLKLDAVTLPAIATSPAMSDTRASHLPLHLGESMTRPNEIHLNVASARDLLDDRSSPLSGRSLHPDAVHVLRSQAEQCRLNVPLQVAIELAETDVSLAAAIRETIAQHFRAEVDESDRDLQRIFRQGGISSGVGLLFAAALRSVGHAIGHLEISQVSDALGESLTVFSWVAMWRPAELLLYEHLPVRRRRTIARALADADIVVRIREDVESPSHQPSAPVADSVAIADLPVAS